MRIDEGVKLDFCDVLIRPKRSNAPSRKNVNLTRYFKMPHTGFEFASFPIIASNLDTTGTFRMAEALSSFQACTALHKFHKPARLIEFFSHSDKSRRSFYTLGLNPQDFSKLDTVAQAVGSLPLICLDVANGYTKQFINLVATVRKLYPKAIIMAGNVATPEMVQELILEGADIVKVGIGPGSHCTTRLMTGVGYPQLSAIIECADAAHGLNGLICADGGCKTSADIAKAFGAGADFVMLGGMLAGTDECDGLWTTEGLKVYGMSSREAQEKYYGEVKDYCAPEGRMSIIPAKGPVHKLMLEISGGLRSACAYVGANGLRDLCKCTTFVRVNRVQ